MLARQFFRCCLVLGLIPALLHAADLPAQFTLGRYVPEDCWMFVHGAHNPEAAWVEARWSELLTDLKNSEIDKDVKGLILSMLDGEQKAQFEAGLSKVLTLVNAVHWGDLMSKEMVIGERLCNGMPGYEYIFLTRGSSETANANMAGIVAIQKEIASLLGDLKVENSTKDGVEVSSLKFKGSDGALAYDVSILRKGDIIGVVMGLPSVATVTAMLGGKSEAKPIIENAKFKEAMTHVPAPEDSVAYFNLKAFIGNLPGLFDMAMENEKSDKSKEKSEDAHHAKQFVKQLAEIVDCLDYSITTEETDGHRSLNHSYTKLTDTQKSALGKSLYERKPFEKFDKYIPAEATSFSVNTFIDIEVIYNTIIDFVEKTGPDGKAGVEQFKAQMASIGFDPQRDFFSWWSGEMISFDMPAAVITPMSQSDSVLMIRVKNSAVASEKVGSALKTVSGLMQASGQSLVVKPVEGASGFNEIVYGPLAMLFKPVVGVKDEWLFVASSAGAVNKSLAVASGKAPSVLENPRYKSEGLIPKGPVMSASFADTSKSGQEAAATLAMVGMFSGMATAGIPADNPEAQKFKTFIQKASSIVAKLAPIAQKIDFYSSESATTTKEGLVVRTEKVTTYNAESMNKVKTAKANPPTGK